MCGFAAYDPRIVCKFYEYISGCMHFNPFFRGYSAFDVYTAADTYELFYIAEPQLAVDFEIPRSELFIDEIRAYPVYYTILIL